MLQEGAGGAAHGRSEEQGAGGARDGRGRGARSERHRWVTQRRVSKERASGAGLGRGGRRPSRVSKRCPDENKRRWESKLWCTSRYASVRRKLLASNVLFVALSNHYRHMCACFLPCDGIVPSIRAGCCTDVAGNVALAHRPLRSGTPHSSVWRSLAHLCLVGPFLSSNRYFVQ